MNKILETKRVSLKCQTCNESRLEHLNLASLLADHKCMRETPSDKY